MKILFFILNESHTEWFSVHCFSANSTLRDVKHDKWEEACVDTTEKDMNGEDVSIFNISFTQTGQMTSEVWISWNDT